ncbi:MAG TPA: secretin N-terminal domain-containing protein [Candidatus Atribacteria bacterium]|nr:secretin N-terminal domain-containing protein [Candidatus Atribacteria bacterium]
MFFLVFFSGSVLALELRDLFWRANGETIKLTFKFSEGASWMESSPDPYHIVVDVEGATNGLGYDQRPMGIGPLRNIMFVEKDNILRLWVELREKVDYEIYDEAGGRLVSMIFHLPPGRGEEKLFSFDFRDAEVRDVLLALAQAAGVNMVVDDSVTGTISVSFENLTFDQALGYIMTMRGLGQIKLGNNIVVAKRNILEENFGLLETRRFELKYIDPEKAKETLSLLIPEGSRIVADQSSRAVIVKGRQEELNQVQEMLKEIDHPLETRTFYLSNNLYREEGDLEKIKNLLKIVIPEEDRVGFDVGQKAIVVKGTPEEIEAASQLLRNLDRKRPQIMIDVKMVEIDRQKVKDLGFTWEVGGVTGTITFGELSLGGAMERQDLVEVTLNALTKENKAHLVGNPRILTLSGEKATITVGDRVPYRNIQGVDEEGRVIPGGVEFLEVGVKLDVTPLLTEDQMILVEVKPEVSSFTEREYYLAGQRYTDPQVKTRSAETTARLKSGETLVIGGLIRSEDIENITRIPILGEIPVIGELFVLRNKTHEETELIIFITPHIIEY